MNFFASLFGKTKSALQTDYRKCEELVHKVRNELGAVDSYMSILLAQAAVIREGGLCGDGHQRWVALRCTGVDTTSIMDPVNDAYSDLPHSKVDLAISKFCFAEASRLRQHPATLTKAGRDVCSIAAYGLEIVGYGFRSFVSPADLGDKSWTLGGFYTFSSMYKPIVIHQSEDVFERMTDLQAEAEILGLGFSDDIFTAWEARHMHCFM